jgi:protein-tyrosine-phosphatase
VAWADVILASEADHVRYVRSNFPEHAGKAVQLYQFVRHAPLDAPFDEQLATSVSLEPDVDLDVADPAGGDQAVYDACAQQLWALSQAFCVLVTDGDYD